MRKLLTLPKDLWGLIKVSAQWLLVSPPPVSIHPSGQYWILSTSLSYSHLKRVFASSCSSLQCSSGSFALQIFLRSSTDQSSNQEVSQLLPMRMYLYFEPTVFPHKPAATVVSTRIPACAARHKSRLRNRIFVDRENERLGEHESWEYGNKTVKLHFVWEACVLVLTCC